MIIQGSQAHKDLDLRTQVVVVGSGSGGAVCAKELAEAGRDVLLLEEGPYVPPEVYGRWRPSKTLRKLGRAGGMAVVLGIGDSPSFNILAGSCVGGSSVLTGGVCFRIPSEVHETWVRELGVSNLCEEAMVPFYERVEQMLQVEQVPATMRSLGTRRFAQGLHKMGIELKPMHRNIRGCQGSSRCNFGCPHQAKFSADLTYLPRAMTMGAELVCDARVQRILTKGRRAVGVEGVLLDLERRPVRRFRVRAEQVILAAGTLHTPLLMLRSKLGRLSGQVGRHLTLHPSFRVTALFDDPIENWKGAMQSAYCNHPTDDTLLFNSIMTPPGVLIATLPGMGPAWSQSLPELFPHLAAFGGMVHDDAGGQVSRAFGTEPLLTYRLSPRNKTSIFRGIRFMAEAFFAAGAKRVYLPLIGAPPLHKPTQLDDIHDGLSARRLESVSFHPLGTCRMGTDPKHAVVDPNGESFELQDLFVADGSIFPTSVGVNTQIPIMTMATRIAFAILGQL